MQAKNSILEKQPLPYIAMLSWFTLTIHFGEVFFFSRFHVGLQVWQMVQRQEFEGRTDVLCSTANHGMIIWGLLLYVSMYVCIFIYFRYNRQNTVAYIEHVQCDD